MAGVRSSESRPKQRKHTRISIVHEVTAPEGFDERVHHNLDRFVSQLGPPPCDFAERALILRYVSKEADRHERVETRGGAAEAEAREGRSNLTNSSAHLTD